MSPSIAFPESIRHILHSNVVPHDREEIIIRDQLHLIERSLSELDDNRNLIIAGSMIENDWWSRRSWSKSSHPPSASIDPPPGYPAPTHLEDRSSESCHQMARRGVVMRGVRVQEVERDNAGGTPPDREEFLRARDLLRSAISPVRRMPTELWVEIFEMACQGAAIFNDCLGMTSLPWVIGRVCRRWRDISTSLSSLSDIHINGAWYDSFFSTFSQKSILRNFKANIERSGSSPLKINLTVNIQFYMRNGLHSNDPFAELIDCLCQHSSRWKSLLFETCVPEHWQRFAPVKGHLECLESLRFCLPGGMHSSIDFFTCAPRLRAVDVVAESYASVRHDIQQSFAALTIARSLHPWKADYGLLAGGRYLAVCSLRYSTAETLANLEPVPARTPIDDTRHLESPSLPSITEDIQLFQVPPLVSFRGILFPPPVSLTCLALDGPSMRFAGVVKLLRSASAIRQLRISLRDPSVVHNVVHSLTYAKPVLVSALESLALIVWDKMGKGFEQRVLAMVQARWCQRPRVSYVDIVLQKEASKMTFSPHTIQCFLLMREEGLDVSVMRGDVLEI